jgi:hypothetical protein
MLLAAGFAAAARLSRIQPDPRRAGPPPLHVRPPAGAANRRRSGH